jgi:nicotinate-nucleotide pyrophosphorylase (carboxylating)
MHSTTLALIRAALAEDIGPGDVTSTYFLGENAHGKARITAREPGIVFGMEIAEAVFKEVDSGLGIWIQHPDGSSFAAGDTLIEVEGRTRSLLTAERTALNFLQRLSGVATMTARYVDAVKPYPVEVWDTRKTTPGWRLIEKQAVKAGGGVNHRMGLYDAVMVKDNHLAANGTLLALQTAIDRVRAERPGIRVQLEAATLEQLADFLSLTGIDLILLDNMNNEQLRQAVALNAGRLWLEASGGITLETIHEVAATGVNSISSGALTHSVRALDLALDLF